MALEVRKLQRVILDALEDVKAQDIRVFDTEHLSALFERVIVASGTSNRQTRSLAASVRDAVKGAGGPQPRTEGEENGEWIIVDCGPAVVHVMQPAIRAYYHLEELWGEKPVRSKATARKTGLVQASEDASAPAPAAGRPAAKKASARSSAGASAPAAAKKAPRASAGAASGTPARPSTGARARGAAPGAAAPRKTAARPAPARKAPARKTAGAAGPARTAAPAPRTRSGSATSPARAPAKKRATPSSGR